MLPLSLAGAASSARDTLESNGVAGAARVADWMNFRRVMGNTSPQMARKSKHFYLFKKTAEIKFIRSQEQSGLCLLRRDGVQMIVNAPAANRSEEHTSEL